MPRHSCPSSVSSRTSTLSSLVPGVTYSVTSKLKARYPFRWLPTLWPFQYTVQRSSTAPKWRMRRLPSGRARSSIVLLYQSVSPGCRIRFTPERAVSGEKGTRICPSGKRSAPAFDKDPVTNPYSHHPFRQVQSARRICGLGYSGSGTACGPSSACSLHMVHKFLRSGFFFLPSCRDVIASLSLIMYLA